MSGLAVLAFMPGQGELLVLLVIGLLIFGRRLPEVGRTIGKTVVDLRRGMQDFKRQITSDEDFGEVRSTVHELRKATEVPRSLTPERVFDALAEEAERAEQEERDEPHGDAPGGADRPDSGEQTPASEA